MVLSLFYILALATCYWLWHLFAHNSEAASWMAGNMAAELSDWCSAHRCAVARRGCISQSWLAASSRRPAAYLSLG
jgi:hypothetical protein